jgi:hypothetical protein
MMQIESQNEEELLSLKERQAQEQADAMGRVRTGFLS